MKLAAIDIGSNAVRLLIVRVNENPNDKELFKKLEFVRVPIRLGDDSFKHQRISKEKSKIFKKSMQSFKFIHNGIFSQSNILFSNKFFFSVFVISFIIFNIYERINNIKKDRNIITNE